MKTRLMASGSCVVVWARKNPEAAAPGSCQFDYRPRSSPGNHDRHDGAHSLRDANGDRGSGVGGERIHECPSTNRGQTNITRRRPCVNSALDQLVPEFLVFLEEFGAL